MRGNTRNISSLAESGNPLKEKEVLAELLKRWVKWNIIQLIKGNFIQGNE